MYTSIERQQGGSLPCGKNEVPRMVESTGCPLLVLAATLLESKASPISFAMQALFDAVVIW
jgi:hypothetical protein